MGSVPVLALCFLFILIGAKAGNQNGTIGFSRPKALSLGALFTLNSTIGKAAKFAIELAVGDVNNDPSVLPGTRLSVIIQDTNCSGFLGIIEGIVNCDN